LATAMVITFLERLVTGEEETWELVVEKARDWLDASMNADVLKEVWKEAENIVPRERVKKAS
jgi:hypothetical protein